jgi:hypothetical protein
LERIRCFNKLKKECEKNDLLIEVHTTVNNSAPGYAEKLERMHRKFAEFPYYITDIGKWDHYIELSKPVDLNGPDGIPFPLKKGESVVFESKVFDLYRLMAEIFNAGMDYAVKNHIDFYSIMSGDQLVPEDHAAVLVKFLDDHPNAGLVGSLVYCDFSKKRLVRKGRTVEAYEPMVDMSTPEERLWLRANLLPNEENGYTGLQYAEVKWVGTGGSMMPFDTFSKLRFHTEFDGRGEDVRFCEEVRSVLGKKVFINTDVVTPNRYASGERY